MGFFDKLTDQAKKLGEKLTSEETKEAIKSGAAKASSGIATGFQMLKDKVEEASQIDIKTMFDILVDEGAGNAKWQSAFNAAKQANLKESRPELWYMYKALAIYRGVGDESGADAMARAMVMSNYEGFMADEDDSIDMTYQICDDLEDMMEDIFDAVSEKDDKDFYDYFYLIASYMDAMGTERDYWMAMDAARNALFLSEEMGGDRQSDNDASIMALKNQCQKNIAKFDELFDTLLDDNAGQEAWEEATQGIGDITGLDNLVYASYVLMATRKTLDVSGSGIDVADAVADTVYLALYRGEPMCEYTLRLHTDMAKIVPEWYADIVYKNVASSESRHYALLACAYLYGWGVSVDTYKAKAYAAKLDAAGRSGDENDIGAAELIGEFIENN